MKKILLFSCVALLLSACGGSQSSNSKNTAKRDFMQDVANIMANENYHAEAFYCQPKVSEEYHDFGVLEQYNSKALYWIDNADPSNSIGVLSNGSLGMFEYTLDKGGFVVLGNFLNYDGGYSLGYNFETPLPLFDTEIWTASTTEGVYECRNEDAIEVFASLTGMSQMAEKYGSKYIYTVIKGSYDEDGTMNLSLNGFKGEELVVIGKLTLKNIGETHNDKVEEYVKQEREVSNPTDWTPRQLKEIKEFFGGDNAQNLPFPKGASYAIKVSGMEEYNEAMISDVGCGDLSASYIAQLQAEGFTVSNAAVYYICRKDGQIGSTKYTWEVYVSYYSKADIISQYGEGTAAYYPNGRFQIEISCERATNSTLKTGSLSDFDAWMDTNVEFAFPKTGWKDVVSVQWADRTDFYNGAYASEGIEYKSVTSVKFFIEKLEDAKADFEAFEARLLMLGYKKETETEGDLTFYFYILGKNEIDLSVNYSGGKYGGFVQAMYWSEK